ncbi:MAG: hypothetical protein AB7P14_19205 [Blastocatellales bacterium]
MRQNFLIALLFLLCTSIAIAQDKPTKYGEIWVSLSDSQKFMYLQGYRDGINATVSVGFILTYDCPGQPPYKMNEVSKKVLPDFDNNAITKVMTDIYKDPANVFIPFSAMVGLANDKLNGENIEEKLRTLRKAVVDMHEKNMIKK